MLAWQINECSTGRVVWFSVCLSTHLVRPDLDPTFTNLLTLWPSTDSLSIEPAWFCLWSEDNIRHTELSPTFRWTHRLSGSASESSETLWGGSVSLSLAQGMLLMGLQIWLRDEFMYWIRRTWRGCGLGRGVQCDEEAQGWQEDGMLECGYSSRNLLLDQQSTPWTASYSQKDRARGVWDMGTVIKIQYRSVQNDSNVRGNPSKNGWAVAALDTSVWLMLSSNYLYTKQVLCICWAYGDLLVITGLWAPGWDLEMASGFVAGRFYRNEAMEEKKHWPLSGKGFISRV